MTQNQIILHNNIDINRFYDRYLSKLTHVITNISKSVKLIIDDIDFNFVNKITINNYSDIIQIFIFNTKYTSKSFGYVVIDPFVFTIRNNDSNKNFNDLLEFLSTI
jgi:hypothetical protein